MFPFFTFPLAFVGLLALPALVAIYWLRNRYRRHTVSSLMLWLDAREARAGGTRFDRLQTPLLFFLELLAFLLLVLAAADPQVIGARGARPLVVVLDDSYSMQAGGDPSSRSRALAALGAELRGNPRYSIRFILAGERPLSLGEPVRTAGEALDLLKQWQCKASTACLDESVSLASEVGGEWAVVLVLTDHPPARDIDKGRLQWWAFGEPRPNLALVSAARTARDEGERCLLEVANLSDKSQATTLLIETGEPAAELQRSALSLEPGETRRVILPLKEGTPFLRARLDPDALDVDNGVTLLPAVRKPVRVEIRLDDDVVRGLVDKALEAAGGVLRTATRPDLLVTDRPGAEATGDTWLVQILVEKDAEAFAGPFVLDRAHPLTEGLGLRAVIWGAGKTPNLDGAPVVMAGNVPLLTDLETATGRHEVRLRLRPDLSTLQDTPNWPALVWNLLHWQAAQAPGMSRRNYRLGEEAVLTLSAAPKAPVQLAVPDGSLRTLAVQGRRVVVRAEEVGLYEVRTEEGVFPFAVNAVNRDESDLSACATGRWGDWLDETSLRLEYQSVAWVFLLLVLAVATVHLYLVARGTGRVGS